MKIIFLDIDGVVKNPKNHSEWYQESINLINKLCLATGAKIVISSNWKLLKKISFFNELFDNNVIGVTPDVQQQDYCKEPEVLAYVRQNKIEDWIAIDDKAYEYPRQAHKLVLTTDLKFGMEEFKESLKRLSGA
jgi:hypothetical protein